MGKKKDQHAGHAGRGHADGPPAEKAPEPNQRVTYHVRPDLVEKLRDAAWWDRRSVTDLVNVALERYLHELERKRGEPYPERGGALRRGRPLA